MGVTRASVRVHIGELVLEGFPTLDRDVVAARLSRELARLVTERGVPDGLTRIEAGASVDAGAIAAPANARALGEALAGAVYGGLGR